MFDFEWTGRRDADDADESRGIDAAIKYCADNGIDAAKAYAAMTSEDATEADIDLWFQVEGAAVSAMCEGWHQTPDYVGLIWID